MIAARDQVRQFLHDYSVKVVAPGHEFQLSSGGASRLYIDAKKTVLHRSMHRYVGELLFHEVHQFGAIDAVAGVVLGDCHLASLVAMTATIGGAFIPSDLCYHVLAVRKEAKDHGTCRAVEGPWTTTRGRVVLLEDVISTGANSNASILALEEEGWETIGVVALVDRRKARVPRLNPRTGLLVPIRSVFTLEDLGVDEQCI